MCGEKGWPKEQVWFITGSPPRVRGKVFPFNFQAPSLGITPACAGKSRRYSAQQPGAVDHPRVCGEKCGCVCVCVCGWITPACAGKSRTISLSSTRSGDHPRVCGEKKATDGQRADLVGSPPRVRGKAIQRNAYTTTARITPACAGKSAFTLDKRHAIQDHPRVCGEKTKKIP